MLSRRTFSPCVNISATCQHGHLRLNLILIPEAARTPQTRAVTKFFHTLPVKSRRNATPVPGKIIYSSSLNSFPGNDFAAAAAEVIWQEKHGRGPEPRGPACGGGRRPLCCPRAEQGYSHNP